MFAAPSCSPIYQLQQLQECFEFGSSGTPWSMAGHEDLTVPGIVFLKIYTSPNYVEDDIAIRTLKIGRRLLDEGRAFESANPAYIALGLFPANAHLQLLLADGFVAQGKLNPAARRYKKVLELDPDNPVARKALAELEQ